MSGKHGVNNLQKFVELLAEGGNVAEDIHTSNGGLFSKIAHLSDLFDEVMAIMNVDFAELKKEASELDEADLKSLTTALKEKLDLADDAFEGKVESAIDLIVEGKDFVEKVIAFSRSLKKEEKT